MTGRSAVEILVWGRHVVEEALRSSSARVHEIFRSGDAREGPNVGPVRSVTREALTRKTGTDKHQGIAARVSLDAYDTMAGWFESCEPGGAFTALAADGVEDPQNLGSLIRSAHFFGADVFVMTRDRAAPLTGIVAKASAGALFSLPIVRAVNLARELEDAAERAFWVVGLDAKADKSLRDLGAGDRHVLLAVGSEGSGLRDLTKKRCHELRSLSGSGRRESLNVAVAGALALYEVGRQRGK